MAEGAGAGVRKRHARGFGVESASSTIDAVSHYLPQSDLKPGESMIVQTAQPPGYSDGIDSRNAVPLSKSAGTDSIPVVRVAADLATNNFGELTPPCASSL